MEIRIDTLLDLVAEICDRRSKLHLSGDKRIVEGMVRFLADLKLRLRFYSVTSKSELEPLWAMIRENEVQTDFICNCTTDFYLHYCTMNGITNEQEMQKRWTALIETLANGLGALRPVKFNDANLVSDEVFYTRSLTTEEWKKLFAANAWLVFLFLLEKAPLRVTIGQVIDPPPEQK